jgi:ATP-dependent DNA helicase RecG
VHVTDQVTDQVVNVTDQVTDHKRKKYLQNVMETVDRRVMVIEFCSKPKTAKEIMEFLKLKHKHTFRENILWPLLKSNLLRMTIPDKPNSRLQKYVAVKSNQDS